MELSNIAQFYSLLFSFLFGGVLGLIYTVLSVFRISFGGKTLTSAFLDAVFWAVAAVSSFYFIFNVNSGVVRVYLLAGVAAGMLIFLATLGKTVTRLITKLLRKIKRKVKKLIAKVRAPVEKAANIVEIRVRAASKGSNFFDKNFKKHFKNTKKSSIIKDNSIVMSSDVNIKEKRAEKCKKTKRSQRGKRVE